MEKYRKEKFETENIEIENYGEERETERSLLINDIEHVY